MIAAPKPETAQEPDFPQADSDPPRIEFVDGLRALLAIFVMLHHAWLIVWPIHYHEYPLDSLTESLTTWLSFGHFGVTAFIVISGFCLGLPIARKGAAGWRGALEFYKRRAWRIVPPFYASILVASALILTLIGAKTGTHWDANLPLDFSVGWSTPLLLSNILGGPQFNTVYWSIAVECQIYLVFPLLVWIWLRSGPWIAALVGTVAGYLIAIQAQGTMYQGLTAQFLSMFCMGFLAACITQKAELRLRASRVPWVLLAAACVVGVGLYLRPITLRAASPAFLWLDFPMGFATAAILIAGCLRSKPVIALLEYRRFLSLGAFSYSLYLLHMPFLQLTWQYLIHPLELPDYAEFALLVPVGGAVAIGASWLFYRLVERHFDPLAKRRAEAA